jgi:hypothetical protein
MLWPLRRAPSLTLRLGFLTSKLCSFEASPDPKSAINMDPSVAAHPAALLFGDAPSGSLLVSEVVEAEGGFSESLTLILNDDVAGFISKLAAASLAVVDMTALSIVLVRANCAYRDDAMTTWFEACREKATTDVHGLCENCSTARSARSLTQVSARCRCFCGVYQHA